MKSRILLVATPLLLTFLLVAIQIASAAGSGLTTIQKADVNHDGNLDVVGLVNGNVPNVSVLLGNGKGGFSAPIVTDISTSITNIEVPTLAVGDFNGDGFPDVAFTGTDSVVGTFAIGVMLGKGDGTFQPTAVYDLTSARGGQLTTGDFTGHGNVDIALTGGQNTAVLPNNGNGTFGTAIITTSSLSSNCAAAGDFNNDGKLDLATASAIQLGNGDGTFQSPITVPSGGCAIAVADMNHDGNLDLITSSAAGVHKGAIRVHLNDGTAHFTAGTSYLIPQYGRSALALADFNGDGALDVAVVDQDPADFTILLNKGNGTLTVSNTFNQGSVSILAGDFNNDGKQDVVVSGDVGTPLNVMAMLGNGKGSFNDALAQNDEVNAFILVGDFNNDHKVDLLTYGSTADVQLGNGNGTFQNPIPLPSGCNGLNVSIGDFNHDGNLDVAATVRGGSGGVAVCLGNGDGTFGNPTTYDSGILHTLIAVGDFNNDGKLDLAVSDVGGVSILLGNGNGTFQPGIPTTLANVSTLFVGDFNNDGKLDVADNTGQTLSVLLGKGDGTFQAPVITSPSPGNILAVGDLNKDGKLDLVTTASLGINVVLGNGDGTFRTPVTYHALGTPTSAVLADFKHNGILDIAVGAFPNDVEVYFGKGDGTFPTTTLFYSGNGHSYLAAADFNGDGALDLGDLTDSASADKLVVFLNPK